MAASLVGNIDQESYGMTNQVVIDMTIRTIWNWLIIWLVIWCCQLAIMINCQMTWLLGQWLIIIKVIWQFIMINIDQP